MVAIGQSFNHIAAAMCRVEAAVRNELTNRLRTSSSNKWILCGKKVEASKFLKF